MTDFFVSAAIAGAGMALIFWGWIGYSLSPHWSGEAWLEQGVGEAVAAERQRWRHLIAKQTELASKTADNELALITKLADAQMRLDDNELELKKLRAQFRPPDL